MAEKARPKIVGAVKQVQYALLRDLTDSGTLDAPSLEAFVEEIVRDRLALAAGMMRAAKLLAAQDDLIIKRSAVSRAYYAAYHAARATVFAIRRHDEDDHDKLGKAIGALLGDGVLGDMPKNLRQVRNEMDYSPYPGPDPETRYDDEEINGSIADSMAMAETLIQTFERRLAERR